MDIKDIEGQSEHNKEVIIEKKVSDKQPTHSPENKQDEIDFSALKKKIKGLFSGSNSKRKQHEKDTETTVNVQSLKQFYKTNAKWLLPVALILIALFASVYLRTMPLRMPVADEWAENTVHNFYKQEVESQINQQYPNLPPQNKDVLIDRELQKIKEQNKEQIERDIATLSKQYRDQFRNDEGTLYLLGIDPYYYFYQSANVLENGHPGTTIKDDQIWDYNRLAPLGVDAEWNFHNWFGAFLHKFINIFTTMPLMKTFFFVGVIFSAFTVIPGFFLGRRISGNNVGGFFTAFLLAVTAFFVSRTTGESSDTDVYTVFFPVLIAFIFVEALHQENRTKKFLLMGLAGLVTGFFSFAWTGWWYIAGFVSATLIIDVLYNVIVNYLKSKKLDPKTLFSTKVRNIVLSAIAYIAASGIFVTIFTSFAEFKRIVQGPFSFLYLKAVGVSSYWPNIRTTVAELNAVSFTDVINQLGGKFLFVLALLGLILVLFRKNAQGKRELNIAFFLAIWLIATLFATTKGVRFILQATPVFAIAVGICLGLIWFYVSRWLTKEFKLEKTATQIIVLLILALILIQPAKAGYEQAYHSVPSMSDGWFDALSKIKNQAPEKIIITSWWDFGHWFRAIAERPVTFDGGNQVGWGAHWVGKSLLTAKEEEAVGIVRMLNCGQNTAFNTLNAIFNDTPKIIEMLNQIVVLDKEEAALKLREFDLNQEQINSVLASTHCQAPTDYFITSEDMVGKSGVWGHFGSWDFERADMYLNVKKMKQEEALTFLNEQYDFSRDEAYQLYNEIQSSTGDQWIAPWPSYQGSFDCKQENDGISCPIRIGQNNGVLKIDNNKDASIQTPQGLIYPNSIVYATDNSINEKKFQGELLGLSVILLPDNQIVLSHPLQAKSVFTQLFFFQGQGLECFEKFDDRRTFTGGRIITWKLDFTCA